MRGSTLISLVVSALFAAVAVFGVRTYLADQRNALLGQGAAEAAPQHTIIVAARELRFGHPVRDEDLKLLPWPSKNLPEGGFATKEDLLGTGKDAETRYVMSAIERDEPVLAGKITGAGGRATLSAALSEGMKAVSIRVNDVLGVAGFVLPGDRVDVLLTRNMRQNDSEQTYVDVLLQGVKVLAIDQVADDRKDQPSVSKTVTFEVTTGEAQMLTLAANVGTLSLTLRNVASAGVEQTRPITLADLGGGPMSQTLKNEMSQEEKDRLGTLERMVTEMLNRKPEQVVVEKEVVVEKQVPVLPPAPDFVVVGVTRNDGRKEYRFETQ
ncbi:Flp pilus assembly protein CpaB [Chelativorans salis]|uniref:Flp pilus assembly protein CpaB n=1 Tax=Chelativorans salis TaxID=2978478 RepID=A0ABT2LJH1_9HYPH|nr:Flp pilus assembly protein CpaB [Chelativorans sp. EGI FJ00035]MCT7374648.1 Flp pilus assembly protein CpaB [Chelativorans sp. EGI FJ00035]